MRLISRTCVFLTATGLAISLLLAGGSSAAGSSGRVDQAGAVPHSIVILKHADTASGALAGFGTSPGGRAACTKGNHFNDPKIG